MARERKSVEMTVEMLKRELFLAGKKNGYLDVPASSEHEIYINGWNEGQAERLKEQNER